MTEIPDNKRQIFSNFNTQLDQWVVNILSDPVTKKSCLPNDFETVNGVIDARVFLENTYGFTDWKLGQVFYEYTEASGAGYSNRVEAYKQEIEYDRPIYQHFKMNGAF